MATKKKYLKAIRYVAAQIPAMNQIKTLKKEVLTGKELLKNKVTKLPNGTDVEQDKKYQRMIPLTGPMNHVKNMKKLVGKYGKQGIGVYIDAIQKIVNPKP